MSDYERCPDTEARRRIWLGLKASVRPLPRETTPAWIEQHPYKVLRDRVDPVIFQK